jgi:hypothetical protein
MELTLELSITLEMTSDRYFSSFFANSEGLETLASRIVESTVKIPQRNAA